MGGIRPQPHVVLFILLLKHPDNFPAHQGSQRGRYVGDVQTKLAGLISIDVDLQLRLSVGQGCVDISQARILAQLLHQRLGIGRQAFQVGAHQVERQLRAASAATTQRRNSPH